MKRWSTNARAKADTRPWALEKLAAEKGHLELANMLARLRIKWTKRP